MITENTSVVFLVLTDNLSDTVINHYREIAKSIKNVGPTVLLFHQSDKNVKFHAPGVDLYCFDDEVLTDLNYLPIGKQLVPGNNHFPLLKYYLEYPDFEYYWLIENDVRFIGDWNFFFDSFGKLTHDFISSHIRDYPQEPDWYWWDSFRSDGQVPGHSNYVRSFNPIYRISNAALKCVHNLLIDGWQGHHEVLIPTILKYLNYKILDFGGNGPYVMKDFYERFYVDCTENDQGILDTGSMRWRPVINKDELILNKLFHPCKWRP